MPFRALCIVLALATLMATPCLVAFAADATVASIADGPLVPEGFVVDVVAKEPLVRNPCVLAFDRLGRICVAQGQQWRAPTPETPGDRIDILIDDDGDGVADRRKTFAGGFNSVQGIAWHGNDLWVANAPDLTVVRDTDGDDEADVYFRVYTGLGNLEHSLHGLNFGPDGKLYMSKGNSKGYNRLDQLAPKPFRELWGLASPEGAPDYPPVEKFTPDAYQRKYHTPNDDWGQQGGILRCDPYPVRPGGESKVAGDARNSSYLEMGRNLEIFSRGFRNPWDISFDDSFTWLGTDNDQTQGDRIFAPFYGAHFGWGHRWSFHWTGENHLPTVPNSASLFEGSGTGVIHYHAEQFPPEYRGVFFVNDWMRREIYTFRPAWDGALMKCEGGFPPTFAHADGGRSLPQGSGRVFEPTDLEVGPDGALYVLSWGHGYGANLDNGKQTDAGRLYRIRHAATPLIQFKTAHRSRPLSGWTLAELFADLGSHIPAWRTAAQEEFLKRGDRAKVYLNKKLNGESLSSAEETWTLWTLGRLGAPPAASINRPTPNRLRQAIRVAAFQARSGLSSGPMPAFVVNSLESDDARIRHEAVLALHQATSDSQAATDSQPLDRRAELDALVELAQTETDRVVYHSAWKALAALASLDERNRWLEHEHARVRLAALLGLLEDDALVAAEVLGLRRDTDETVAAVANSWLEKTGGAAPIVEFNPPPGEYTQPLTVTLKSSVGRSFLTYTLDGSRPTYTSPRVGGPIPISRTTQLRVAVNVGNTGGSLSAKADYVVRIVPPYRHRPFARDARTPSGRQLEFDWTGLQVGKRQYTDRTYHMIDVPPELQDAPYLRTANNDDRASGDQWLTFTLTEACDVLVGVDVRNNAPLGWMKIDKPGGYADTGLELKTNDSAFRVYRKRYAAGKVVLGGNTNNPRTDSGRGNYIVLFDRSPLGDLGGSTTSPLDKANAASNGRAAYGTQEVLAAMKSADPERGRELFLHPRGAGCFKCHRMEGRGGVLAPDLSDIGTRAKSPQVLIESILEPNRVITEGFAQQNILTVDGKVFSGSVLEETARTIKLAGSDGKLTTIKKEDIEERRGTKLSPMPSGFGRIMTPQQVADVAAWLLTQTVTGDRDGFSFRDRDDQLEVFLAGQRIATYLKRHEKLTRRALVNVTTPRGIQVTRNFPPRAPEDIDPGYRAENGIIHPHMHPGIWLGFGDVNGNDYWRLQAKVEFDGFVEPPRGDKTTGSFSVRNKFMSTDGAQLVCNELSRYRFERVPAGMLIRIDAEYRSDDHDFYFGDQEESGLAVRVASPIRVQGGNGTILNNRGERNGGQVWGKPATWWDYSGTIDGRQIGVMVVPNPKNSRPSWLHARDYGVIVTNPFPKQPKERREPYVKTWVKKGESFKLSYAMLIHDLPADQPLDREASFETLRNLFE